MLKRHRGKIVILLLTLAVLVFANVRLKLFAFHPFSVHDDGDIKVLCLNVHSTGDGFEDRSLRISSMIETEDPDIVYLTEYHDTCSMTLDGLLRDRYDYSQRGIRGNSHQTECIYSKWQIDSIIDVHIDATADKAMRYQSIYPNISSHLYHSAILRCQFSKGGKTVVAYVTHLASNNYFTDVDNCTYHLPSALRREERRWLAYDFGSKLRELEADAILKDSGQSDSPTIVLGDMNDFSRSSSLKLFEDAGMKDAWWERGFGFGCSFRDRWLRLRIDHVFYNNRLELTDVKVIDSDLSDHKPLVAKFRFK